jgi:hypothetical protein
MKNFIFSSFVLIFISATSLLANDSLAYDGEARPGISSNVSGSTFTECNFDFSDETHVTHLPTEANKKLAYDNLCTIYLEFNLHGHYTNAASVWVSMLSADQLDETAAYNGFYLDKNKSWRFKGAPLQAGYLKFRKISFNHIRCIDEITLIGRQKELAKDQSGSRGIFDGIRILRVTPTYLVSMNLSFAYRTPVEMQEAITRDVISLVQSVHIVPGENNE